MKLPKRASHSEARASDPFILGNVPELYRPDHWLPAGDIAVNGFRQVFLWPLAPNANALDHASTDPVGDFVRETRQILEKDPTWDASYALNEHLDETPGQRGNRLDADKFAEQVYFHDFIQESQFGFDPGKAGDAVQLFRRRDVTGLQVLLENDHVRGNFNLTVERHNLYLFESGAAILVLEVASKAKTPIVFEHLDGKGNSLKPKKIREGLRLSDVQWFADHFRRIYPPFFGTDSADEHKRDEDRDWKGRRVPVKVVLEGGALGVHAGLERDNAIRNSPGAAMDELNARSAPPVFPHWQTLVSPLDVAGTGPNDEKGGLPRFRQVIDERIPIMTFVDLAENDRPDLPARRKKGLTRSQLPLMSVSRGDWIRLAYADEPGTDTLPYSPHFLKDFEADCCYDRYFPHPASSDLTSRILCVGYHFAVVGSGWFADTVLQGHFRRHYFQIALAVHMEVASLLATSSRITAAVKANRGTDRQREFEQHMQQIEKDFLRYTHLFHFTGMSNQLQAGELLQLWQKHLRIRELYEDVKNEIDTANQFMLSVDQARQADAAGRLNIIATLGVVLGLVFSFFGMNVVFTESWMTQMPWPEQVNLLGWGIALFSGAGAAVYAWLNKPLRLFSGAWPFLWALLLTGLALMLWW